jgi:hypothetical protein
MDLGHAKLMSYVVPAAIVLLVMGLRMRRMGRMRPLRVERLWIVPVFYLIILALTLQEAPPALADWPWLIVAAILGAGIGWYRGKMMQIIVDPDTHAINQMASPLAMIFLVAIVGLRYGIRLGLGDRAADWHISLNMLANLPLFLGAAAFIATRLEMFLRAQHLLAEAKEAKANNISGQSQGRNIVD